ncbi:MAG: hypothetical protein ABIQ18_20565 [Umezawaea sp.]
MALELVSGLMLGIVIPALIAPARRPRTLIAEPRPQTLGPPAITVILCVVCNLANAIWLCSRKVGAGPLSAERFERFGDLVAETTEFATLPVFGR